MDATLGMPTRSGRAWAEKAATASTLDATEVVTVLLAEADTPGRLGLVRALEHHGLTVIAKADDAAEAFDAALKHRPDVCLLDASIPGGALTAAERIHPELPETRIAMLASGSGDGGVVDAIRAGADGYLLKATAPDRMSRGVRALARGEAVLPRALTARLVAELRAAGVEASVPRRSRIRYVPRFMRHFRRRLRAGMSLPSAWRSARLRMGGYR